MNIKKELSKYILNECLEISIKDFFNQFKSEFEYDYNLSQYPNRTKRLAEYLKGVPSSLSIPSHYNEIEKLILTIDSEANEQKLSRYRNNWFEIVADILIKNLK